MNKKPQKKGSKQKAKLISPQERGRKGGRAAQKSSKVHRLTTEERAKGGKNSRRNLR